MENYDFELSFQSKDPDVVAPSAQIAFPPTPTYNYLEIPGFLYERKGINGQVSDQLNFIRTINDKINKAKPFLPFLYTYRSVFFIFSLGENIKTANNGSEEKIVDYEEYKAKLKEFFLPKFEVFQQIRDFTQSLVSVCIFIMKADMPNISDVLFDRFTELISIIFNLEHLKLQKTGVSRDLSFFKREFASDAEFVQQIGIVQIFLASKNEFLDNLKNQITFYNHGLKKGEKSLTMRFVVQYLRYCINSYKSQSKLPSMKISLLVGMTCALFVHGNENQTYNIFSNNICKEVFEILAETPVIPLYCEGRFIPGEILSLCAGFIPNKQIPLAVTTKDVSKSKQLYMIKNNIPKLRAQYRSMLPIATHCANEDEVNFHDMKSLVGFLTQIVNSISFQNSFKFVIPAKLAEKENEEEDDDGNPIYCYDLAVGMNYTDEDLDALAETIGYLKTLASAVMANEPTITAKIGRSINKAVMKILNRIIPETLQRVEEQKDEEGKIFLLGIQEVFKSKTEDVKAPIPKETLDMLRMQLQMMISPGSKFIEKPSMFSSSYLKSGQIKAIEKFITESDGWYYLYNFIPNLRKETNLGFLWFHESMLDIDKVAQFPVRSSLPFILMKHLLISGSNGKCPGLQDLVFFPFEIYNDAAWQALNIYESQYLFNEISAEMKLSIEMIAFTFADTFYKLTRETAAAIEIIPQHTGKIIPTPMRYPVMVRQNKMEVLGSPIDFNLITTNKLNTRMREELERIVKMMNDLRFIPYVSHLFRVAKTTHTILVQNRLGMDSFDVIWDSARGVSTPLAVSPKMMSNIENLLDFQHMKIDYNSLTYTYNKTQQITPLSNEKWATKYAELHKDDVTSVGKGHIRDLCKVLNGNEMCVLLKTTIKRFSDACNGAFDYYNEFRTTIRILPTLVNHDLTGYYDFNMDAYSSVSHSLLGKFFAQMRIIGNIIVFVNFLDEVMNRGSNNGLFIVKLMNIMKQLIVERKELFYRDEYLDIETCTTHSNFCSLWSVLEFIFCSPKTFYLSESNPAILLMDTFGDGPIIAAHAFISICNQQSRYEYNSICFHSLELQEMDTNPIEKSDLVKFLYNANKVYAIRNFTISLSASFMFLPE